MAAFYIMQMLNGWIARARMPGFLEILFWIIRAGLMPFYSVRTGTLGFLNNSKSNVPLLSPGGPLTNLAPACPPPYPPHSYHRGELGLFRVCSIRLLVLRSSPDPPGTLWKFQVRLVADDLIGIVEASLGRCKKCQLKSSARCQLKSSGGIRISAVF